MGEVRQDRRVVGDPAGRGRRRGRARWSRRPRPRCRPGPSPAAPRWRSGGARASSCAPAFGSRVAPIFVSTVPTSPVDSPAASSAATARNEVVVLPSVPVIPTTPRSWLGSPYHHAAASARAAASRSTTSCGSATSGSGSLDDRGRGAAPRPPRRRSRGRRRGRPGRRRTALPGATRAGVVGRRRGPRSPASAAGPIARPPSRAPRSRPSPPSRSISSPSGARLGRLGGREQLGDRGGRRHRAASAARAAEEARDPRREPPGPVAVRRRITFSCAPGQLEPLGRRTSACAGTGPTSARPRAARGGRRRRRRRPGPSRPGPRGSRAGSRASGAGGARPGWSRRAVGMVARVDGREPLAVAVQERGPPAARRPAVARLEVGRGGRPRCAARHQRDERLARPERELPPLAGLEQQVVEPVEGDRRSARGGATKPSPTPPGGSRPSWRTTTIPSFSAFRIRCRVDFAIPSKAASSSTPASGSEIRWRDGWISSIGWKPAARSAIGVAAVRRDLGVGWRRRRRRPPRGGRRSRASALGGRLRRRRRPRSGRAGCRRCQPPTTGHGRRSARTPEPVVDDRGGAAAQPLAARCAAQARDW